MTSKEIEQQIIRGAVGTNEQSDLIQSHMTEYFTRFPSYKSKFTDLEWYHIFLDFSDKLPLTTACQHAQGSDRWVSVEDRLPDDYHDTNEIIECTGKYLVLDEVHGVEKAWLKKFKRDSKDPMFTERVKGYTQWETLQYTLHNVTHWQPLPNKTAK